MSSIKVSAWRRVRTLLFRLVTDNVSRGIEDHGSRRFLPYYLILERSAVGPLVGFGILRVTAAAISFAKGGTFRSWRNALLP